MNNIKNGRKYFVLLLLFILPAASFAQSSSRTEIIFSFLSDVKNCEIKNKEIIDKYFCKSCNGVDEKAISGWEQILDPVRNDKSFKSTNFSSDSIKIVPYAHLPKEQQDIQTDESYGDIYVIKSAASGADLMTILFNKGKDKGKIKSFITIKKGERGLRYFLLLND